MAGFGEAFPGWDAPEFADAFPGRDAPASADAFSRRDAPEFADAFPVRDPPGCAAPWVDPWAGVPEPLAPVSGAGPWGPPAPGLRPSGMVRVSPPVGVEPGPASLLVRIGGRPAGSCAGGRSSPAAPASRRSAPPEPRRPFSAESCQSKPPNIGRPCAPVPRRPRSPKACHSVSSVTRAPGAVKSRPADASCSLLPGLSPVPRDCSGGDWGASAPGSPRPTVGGCAGRGGIEARRASVLMHPPFPQVRAVLSCAGPRRSRRCGRRPSGHAYPHGRAGIPARRRRGANSPACVRVTLRVVPGRTGTSPPGRGHLPGTSPYPAVILSGRLRS
jgi:hypothetical protein